MQGHHGKQTFLGLPAVLFFWSEYNGMVRGHLSLFFTLPFSIPNPMLRNALSWPLSSCIALSHARRCLVLVQCMDTASHLLPMRKLVCTRKERFRSSPFGHAGCISSLATRRGWKMQSSTSPPNVSFRYIGGSKASSVEEVRAVATSSSAEASCRFVCTFQSKSSMVLFHSTAVSLGPSCVYGSGTKTAKWQQTSSSHCTLMR